jgi:hypothetical protein
MYIYIYICICRYIYIETISFYISMYLSICLSTYIGCDGSGWGWCGDRRPPALKIVQDGTEFCVLY